MADGAKSGLASGTSGSPQLTLDNDELAAKAKENETVINSTYLNDSNDVVSYSERGVDIPEHIKEKLSQLQNKGDSITGSIGEFSMSDVSIMSKETGVEFARVTIGGKTYLIRGDKGGTVIPNKLLDEMKMHSGTLDFHSHPHNDDCVPSKSDRLMMRKLRQTTGQRESSIVTPNGRTTLFDEHGVIETGTVSSTLDDARRRALMELFGGGK